MLGRTAVTVPVFLLAAAGLAAALGWTTWASAVVPLVLCLFVSVVLLARSRGEGGSVLDIASSGERAGRYAESGGLARDEQDRALREIQEQAEERDER
jgi:hypothetical protein